MSALQQAQLGMAAHLRDPDSQPAPGGVEERRLQIYRDLIFNNIDNFLRSGFPVLHSLYTPGQWLELVRAFINGHRSHTPYFPEIGQEFLGFLMHEHSLRECDPPFMLELAHYEWVELALDIAQEELPAPQAVENLAGQVLQLSPLAWVLSYSYPVHRIGPGYRPDVAEPTFLCVYRDRQDKVCFIALNAATARLLELLRDNETRPAVDVLELLAVELGLAPQSVSDFGLAQLGEFFELGVVLPTALDSSCPS